MMNGINLTRRSIYSSSVVFINIHGPDNLLIELFQSREPERWKIAG